MKDANRLQTIGPNLGDYAQWVHLRAPTGRKVSRFEDGMKEIKETHRVIAVEELEILSHGGGEFLHPIVGHVHGAMRHDREAVRSIGLGADMPSTRVLGPKLFHRPHQNS